MELEDFKAAVEEAAALLRGVQKIAPRYVEQKFLDYLAAVQTDPVGLEVLRNAIDQAKAK